MKVFLAFLMMFATSPAWAGFYIEGRGGISIGTESDFVSSPDDPPPSTFTSAVLEFSFEPHGVGEILLGYEYRGFRLELNAGYR